MIVAELLNSERDSGMNQVHPFFQRKKQEVGIDLNPVQKQAVLHTEGPLLLLASPGSGKTTTIIMRIGYLIEEKGVNPARIKAVTFSRASAQDMRERFSKLFPGLAPVDFSTIHSLAFEVVRDYLRLAGQPYRIIEGDIDSEEQESMPLSDSLPVLHKKALLRKLYKDLVGEKITDDQMDELTTYISYIKNKMIPDNRRSSVKVNVPQAERIMHEYEKFKQYGTNTLLLDYDDMLTICEQALASQPKLLQKYQARYDYVLTDESQDTSMIQHVIIEKLVRPHRNLCVVADEDQSLYSWRGAEPQYLLGFRDVYPDARILYMEYNYRSARNIVEVANQFIRRNKHRYDKHMHTDNPPGKPIAIKSFEHYESQIVYLLQELREVEHLREVAVLYRNHSSSIVLMNELDRAGIPFYMKDADNRFFNHWVVEDILNFMRMTYTDKRADILEKIHLKMNGYISKQQMAELLLINNNQSVFDNLLKHVKLQTYQVKVIEELKNTFQQMRGMPPRPAIQVIRGRLGYEKALEKMSEWMGFRKEYLIGILNALESIADGLATMEQFAERLRYLAGEMGNAKERRGQNAVTLSTLHSAKGLEFERVYMIDLVEGIIPSKEDREDTLLMEEAARLFYVGMTRAKKQLELITYRKRDGEDTTESRFVTEVRNIMNGRITVSEVESRVPDDQQRVSKPKKSKVNPNAIRDASLFRQGIKVRHPIFGVGTIIDQTDGIMYIRFAGQDKVLSIQACIEKGLLEIV
jgi:DNA helicase-2/ATP-dependent DNA helicase PcrA